MYQNTIGRICVSGMLSSDETVGEMDNKQILEDVKKKVKIPFVFTSQFVYFVSGRYNEVRLLLH